MTTNEMIMYDYLVDASIATSEELNLARSLVSGSWEDVINSVLFIRTGYRTFEQFLDYEKEE